MKAVELRRRTAEQLEDEVLRLKREQMNLRFRMAQGDRDGVGRLRSARREAARALTVLAEKRRDEARDQVN